MITLTESVRSFISEASVETLKQKQAEYAQKVEEAGNRPNARDHETLNTLLSAITAELRKRETVESI